MHRATSGVQQRAGHHEPLLSSFRPWRNKSTQLAWKTIEMSSCDEQCVGKRRAVAAQHALGHGARRSRSCTITDFTRSGKIM